MIHSILLTLEKRRGEDPPLLAAEYMWRRPDLPSRALFVGMVEEMYEDVELPDFPDRLEAQIELGDRILGVEAAEPVAPPEEVGAALWAAMARAAGEG